jgi:ATP-binding cassette subfamily B protein
MDKMSSRNTLFNSPLIRTEGLLVSAASHIIRYMSMRSQRWFGIAALARSAGTPLIFWAILLNLLIGLLPLGFVLGTSVMIAHVAILGRHDTPESSAGVWGSALAGFGFGLGSLAMQNALNPAQAAFGELLTRRVDGHCASRLMTAGLLRAPMALLERSEILDDLSDASAGLSESAITPGSAVAGLFALIARYAQLAGAVALVGVALGPLAAVIIAVTACAARFGNRGSLSRWSRIHGGLAEHRRRLRYVMDTGSAPSIAKETRLLGLLAWFTSRSTIEADRYHARLWHSRRQLYFRPFLALTVVMLIGAAAVFIILSSAAEHGALSVLDLSLAVQAVLIPLRFGVFYPECDVQTQYGMSAYDTITRFEERSAVAAARPVQVTKMISASRMPRGDVRFEHVTFSYPETERPILKDLSLCLQAGRSTAIVGLNGAGKTTIVKLLARLYEPTDGRIVVDGNDMRDIDAASWQQRLAVIFQDYVRYELDAGANISMGAPQYAHDHAAIRAVAQRAEAAEFIDALPRGLSTPLSSRYRGGSDLSGGQWQRIAMARALFAVGAGASMLVLDEPTAQLDVRAEVAFFDRFLDLTAGLTTVIISHRFSTVRRADHIVVIDGGRVAEQGSHEQLLRRGGRYAELFRFQATRFADDSDDAS